MITNEDWIKSLDTEELARKITTELGYCENCPCSDMCDEATIADCIKVYTKWLKQEHKE